MVEDTNQNNVNDFFQEMKQTFGERPEEQVLAEQYGDAVLSTETEKIKEAKKAVDRVNWNNAINETLDELGIDLPALKGSCEDCHGK